MDTKSKCEEVMREKGWTQRQLAAELGINEQNMTHALKGRRSLPTAAFIRLEQLRGVKAETIIQELLKTAACVMLAVIALFVTVPENAEANQAVKAVEGDTLPIMAVLRRMARNAIAMASALRRGLGGRSASGQAPASWWGSPAPC